MLARDQIGSGLNLSAGYRNHTFQYMIVGRAGASPPSRTTGPRGLYICMYIYMYIYICIYPVNRYVYR